MVDLAAERSYSDRGSDRHAPASAYDPCHERGELRSKNENVTSCIVTSVAVAGEDTAL